MTPPPGQSQSPLPGPPMGFPPPMHPPFMPPHLPPPPPFSPEMFYPLQPSYDMEYVYPPGIDPICYSESHMSSSSRTTIVTEEEMIDGMTTAEIIASQSQDYIDEKLAEYQLTIQYLQDEQERVQKKTFTNWINSYLAKHVPPLHVVDLIDDLKDGTKLLGLLQVLSNETLPVEKGKNLRRPHYLSNVNTALQFLQNKRIKLVNINATDIVDGRPAVVLGLVWTIILYFQIEENTKILTSLGYRFTQATPTKETESRPTSSLKPSESPITILHGQGGRATPVDKWKQGARRILLQWVQELIKRDSHRQQVTNFGSDWRDGNAFLSVINSIQPNTVDPQSLKSSTNRTRLETAFNIAEKELNIPKLLDPEDVDVPKPDEKSIMTYVAQFLHRQSNEPQSDFDLITQYFDGLITWLNQKIQFNEHMKQTGSLSKSYGDFLNMCRELEEKEEIYKKLKGYEGVANLDFPLLHMLWDRLQLQIKEWQWRLDSLLPEPFNKIGQWIAKAELLLSSHDVPDIMNDEAARTLNSKIEDHKVFFAELPNIQAEFQSALQLPTAGSIPTEQLNSLARRLEAIPPLALKRAVKLKFLEHKCCLVAFIILIENRLKQWTIKYGKEDHAVYLLDQYNNFVNKNKIFQEFQRAYVDMEHVVQEYKADGGIDPRESRAADHFLWEIGERWKNISMELRCVQSMLEEVIAYWRRYNTIHPELEQWVDRSLPMVQLPEDQKLEYFQDLSTWVDKYNLLKDTVNFLSATCDQPVTLEIKDVFSRITTKWNILYQQVKQYQFSGQILKLKNEFNKQLHELQTWIVKADDYLSRQPASVEDCRCINEVLQTLIQEIDQRDEQWRLVNKKFQALLPELQGDEVDQIVKTIKKEKENLVRVRAQLPIRQNIIQQLLLQQEALDAGQDEISNWLSRATELMNSYSQIPLTNSSTCQQLLDQHRIFFNKKLYYKTMLESKNKLLDNIVKSVRPDQRDQFSNPQIKMRQLNNEYASVDQVSRDAEQKLQELIRCWKNFEENKKDVTDWIMTAEKMLNEPSLESKQVVQVHKEYFERINDRPLKDMIKASQDLQRNIPPSDYSIVNTTVLEIGSQWNSIMSRVPVHLTKLEFRLEEEELAALLKDIDKEIFNETVMLSKHEDIQTILQRNQTYFRKGNIVDHTKKCLDRLQQKKDRFNLQYPDDSSLTEQYDQAKTAYNSVFERVAKLNVQLKDIPEQWDAYHKKYEEVSNWMDTVDSTLKSIMTDVGDIETFEKEKSRFLGICREVDQKRDDMKKLVQMLDLLISKSGVTSEEKYMEEQDKLESLISRYKNLVPTIEITMVKTEITSKCYTYREETERICETLTRLKEQTILNQPETLSQVEQQINEYNQVLKSLETEQRPVIISLLQKGKDLQKEPNTLDFIPNQTVLLDQTWTTVFSEINDKVKSLKSCQKIWVDYEKQKNDILGLLDKAESELKRILPGTSNLEISEDLKIKQNLNVELRKATEDTLRKLKDLCLKLEASNEKFKLQEEVEGIETRLLRLLDLLDQKINSIQTDNSKWKSVSDKIAELRDWMLNTQKLLAQLLSMEIPPGERVKKINELQVEIQEKMKLLEEIEQDAFGLGDVPGLDFATQVDDLKVTLVGLFDTVGVQTEESVKVLHAWTQCQDKLNEIQPWIEKAEVKLNVGLNLPTTLPEAKSNLQEIKAFINETVLIKTKFEDAAAEIEQTGNVSSAQDDLDALKNKWTVINNTVTQWRDKVDSLIQNWTKYESNNDSFSSWLDRSEEEIAKDFDNRSATTKDLEAQMNGLKELGAQCSSYQSKLIPITQELDSITQYTSSEGSSALSGNLAKLKERHAKLADNIRKKMIELSDESIQRQEQEGKIANLHRWLDQFNTAVIQVDSVYLNQLDASIQKVHTLIDEYEIHQQDVSELGSIPTQEHATVSEKYQSYATTLESKKGALNNWLDINNWVKETDSSIQHFNRQLLVSGIDEAELHNISEEIIGLIQNAAKVEPKAKSLDVKSQESHIIVKNPTTLRKVTAVELVHEVKDKLQNLDKKVKEMVEAQKKIGSQAQEIKVIHQDLNVYMAEIGKSIGNLKPTKVDVQNLDDTKQQLQTLLAEHEKKQAIKANLGKLCKELMENEPGNISSMTTIIQSIDAEWDKISDLIKGKIQNCDAAKASFAAIKENQDKLHFTFNTIEKNVKSALETIPQDASQTASVLSKVKKQEVTLNAQKPTLDNLNTSTKALEAKLETLGPIESLPLETQIQSLNQQFDVIKETIQNSLPKVETQHVLWKSIEGSRDLILSWLDSTKQALQEADNVRDSNIIRSKLDAYKDQLGEKYNLKINLESKAKQLRALTSKEIPKLANIGQEIEVKFKELEDISKKLENSLENFQDQEKEIKTGIKANSDKITKVKELITKCEDRSGTPADILLRLDNLTKAEVEYKVLKPEFEQVEKKIVQFKSENPKWDDSHIQNLVKSNKKRLGILQSQIETVKSSLVSALEKNYWDKFHPTGKLVGGLVEKVKLCDIKNITDNYTLQAKVASLCEIQDGVIEIQGKLPAVHDSLEVLKKIENYPKITTCAQEYAKLINDVHFIEKNVANVNNQIGDLSSLWEQYEILGDELTTNVRQIETKVKTELSKPVDLSKINDKLQDINTLTQETDKSKASIDKLVAMSHDIVKLAPDYHTGQVIPNALSKLQGITKSISSQRARLVELKDNAGLYQEALQKAQSWIETSETTLTKYEAQLNNKSSEGIQYDDIKNLVESKDGQDLINQVLELGQAILPGITSESKETIRTEIKDLRRRWEDFFDKGNGLLKKLENIKIALSSFDETTNQIKGWLSDIKNKTNDLAELKPTLGDKKIALQNSKALLSDVKGHQEIIVNLKDKMKDYDSAFNALDTFANEYASIEDSVKGGIAKTEKSINDHDKLNELTDNFRDFVSKTRDDLGALAVFVLDKSDDDQLKKVKQNYEDATKIGEAKLKQIEKQLKGVLNGTHPDGRQQIQTGVDALKADWDTVVKDYGDAIASIERLHDQSEEFNKKIEEFSGWLKGKEQQAKDSSFKSTVEAKVGHLKKLEELLTEIKANEKELNAITDEAESYPSNPEVDQVISDLNSRYQAIRPLVQDSVTRCKGYVQDHKKFNDSHADLLNWIDSMKQSCKEISEVIGDANELQERKTTLSSLIEARGRKTPELESVVEAGEHLYAHTSPDGREIIRQQIKLLRDGWDALSDNLQQTHQKLDSCITQFNNFTSSQEELTKWLRSIEASMQVHTQLKGTIQEKNAQLQNHKIVNQEIISHQILVESLCDKAQQLIDLTQDQSLQVYIKSIKQLFQNIKDKSSDLLSKLESCIADHTKLNVALKELKDVLQRNSEVLQSLDDETGEKSDIVRKLEEAKNLQQDLTKNNALIEKVDSIFAIVKQTTNDTGIQSIQAEISSLQDTNVNVLQGTDALIDRFNNILKSWAVFESGLQKNAQLFRNQETFFRSQPLQDTFENKQNTLQLLAKERENVIEYEQEFNVFLEQSHNLLRQSNAEKIKQLLVQINNRYQLLLVLTKEVVNRWQSLAVDHSVFNEKFQEATEGLNTLESNFAPVRDESMDLNERNNLLKAVNVEKQQLGQKINLLFPLSEKIYPDTLASGRETIRQDMRNLRDRYDALDEEINNLIKKYASESQQLVNYNETLQQTIAWLDDMEKRSSIEQEPNWMSVPDIRSKLIKCKAVLQDVISYKRVIENIVDKAKELISRNPNQNFGDLAQVTDNIKTRYEGLTNNLLVGITDLEETLDYVQQWQDLLKKGNDWIKNIKESLVPIAESSGGKALLNDKLKKIDELKSSLGEGQGILDSLESLLGKESKSSPPKLKEYFKKDLLTLKFDYDKLINDVDEARHNLQEQLSHWSEFEDRFERLNQWLEEAEGVLRSYSYCNTIEEKEEQMIKYSDFTKIVDSRGKEVQDFLYLADNVQQKLIQSLKDKEPEFIKVSNDMADLIQQQPVSSETRMSSNVQQIMSRFESTELTAKEILKKATQAYEDHAEHNKNIDKFTDELNILQTKTDQFKQPVGQSSLTARLAEIKDLVSNLHPVMTAQSNNLTESCEKLYPTTGNDGKEIIRNEVQELVAKMESIFDSLYSTENEIKMQLSRWTNFEESKELLRQWFDKVEPTLSGDIELKVTLDEKRSQLSKYRNILKEILEYQQIIIELTDKVAYLPENEESKKLVEKFKTRHDKLLEKCQGFVEQYEGFVCNHQQYMKAVEHFTEWVDGTQSAVVTWGDDSQERTILQAHLERLKNLKSSLPEENYRIEDIRSLGNKVIPGTLESGQENIRSQIDTSQQEWESLLSSIESSINALQQKLVLWTSFEMEKDKFMSWLKETDSKLHAIDLQPTLDDKIQQLHNLQVIQGEVKSRELEVDSISDRALNIQKQGLPLKSSSASISELTTKYQQISSKTKELVQKWQDYVNSHQEFDIKIQETASWLDEISDKLSLCADFNVSAQKDLEGKLANVHDLLLCKEEGFTKIQTIFEKAQSILSNTAPAGHEAINDKLKELQETWNALVSKMIDTKNHLDENIHRWAGFLEQVHQLSKTLEYVESTLDENLPFQATLQEKKSQLEIIKNLEEKLSTEIYEVDMLKTKAQEMISSGQQTQAASQALEILKKFEMLSQVINTLRQERESQYKDHRAYIEAHDELLAWLQRTREKIPMLSQSSGRIFDVENANTVFNNLINKKTQGSLLVERLSQAGEVVLASTSNVGKVAIAGEIKELTQAFNLLFTEIQHERDSLEGTMNLLREWKEEYERLSDWLQQCDIIIKTAKITFLGNIEEKRKQVRDVDEVVQKLIVGKADMDKFNKMAEPLVAKSYLDSHVGTLLQQMNSRYETQVKTATDVLNKVKGNLECHQEFVKSHKKALDWIEDAKDVIADCSQSSSDQNKERLQANIAHIQDLVQRQEQGQKLVHLTVNLGEKVVRTTRSDGKDVVNDQIKEIQSEWDRLVKKISNTKVALETSLLRWADYNSSYTQVQKWIDDREAKLAQVSEPRKPKGILKNKAIPGMSSVSIGDRKANLRVTNTIVQDIVSLEPMIESVTSKAENLRQETPASEISTKYQTLNKKAQEIYAKQKEMVEIHQAFVDLANDLMAWIRLSKEKLVKISEPVGDKDTLSNKITQLKVLQSELPEGQTKLDLALSKGKDACSIVDEDDKELIEQEVALLQEEFDNYSETLTRTQQQLETGLVRWKEWEEQYKDAEEWLNKTENEVKQFPQSQNTLDEKKVALESFQIKLQAIFDWQKELDKLNLLAQQLLDICADSRISNTVTQMTTKFNALLGVTKEVIRRLELQYQEHQQHNALYQECQDWIDRSRDKLTQLSADLSYNLPDVQARLQSVKGMKQTIEQGQNKLRYVLELKDKIMLSSDKEGANKINEDTEILKTDFEKLVADIQETRQNLTTRYNLLEDIDKLHKQIVDWLDDITNVINSNGSNEFGDLSEKRAYLEKLKITVQEVNIQGEMLGKLENKIQGITGMPKEPYLPTFERYEDVKTKLTESVTKMESIVADHENYKKQYNETFDQIRKIRIDLQPFSDATGEKQALAEKVEGLNAMGPTLENGDAFVKKTKEMGAKAIESCSIEGKDSIQQELQQLALEWDSIQGFYKDCNRKLKKCISSWDEFDKIFSHCKSVINDLNARVDAEPETDNATPKDLERVKDLLGEINSHKYSMEDLNEKCEQLIEECSAPRVREDTIQLQSLYTTLVANAQALQSRTHKKLADHTEFLKAKKEIEEWLSRAEGTIQDCSGFADEPIMRENLDTIQTVATRQTEGQHLLNVLHDAFTHLINAVPIEQQDSMRNDVEVIRSRWEDFILNIKNSISKLKETLQQWSDFNEKCAEFDSWATNMLQGLSNDDDIMSDLGTIKTTNERYKSLQNEIESEKHQLDKLTEESQNLFSLSKNEAPVKKVRDLTKKWTDLNNLIAKLRSELENEIRSYTQYNDQLQEIEKWLLHISFQLMAHNSLYITNREQTLEQLEVHEVLLDEIKNYKTVLDDINNKGQEQIQKYGDEVKVNVEKQLKNVLESYDSLLHTGLQIKNRLIESLAKFQEYEDTLESIMANLDAWEPEILAGANVPIVNIEDANSKFEAIRKMHNKLQGEKSRLSLAVHACEAATASLSRPTSPQEALLQPIPDKELAVRSRLEDCIDQVQNQMSDLSAASLTLEGIKASKDGLNQWADDTLATLKDIKNRPSKFRPDTSQLEMNQLQDIRNAAGDKLIQLEEVEIQESGLVESIYLPDLRSKLENIDSEVQNVVEARLTLQDKITEHKNLISSIQAWLDSLSGQLEKLEKPSQFNIDDKLDKIGGISQIFQNDNKQKLNDLKKSSSEIIKETNNIDTQIIEDQVSSLERKFGEFNKRVERKQQILEQIKKNLGDFNNDLYQINSYIKNKNVDYTLNIGYEIQPIETIHGEIKGLLRELDSKEIILSTLEKRLGTLHPELEDAEIQTAENELSKTTSELEKLKDRLKSQLSGLKDSIKIRRKFHDAIDNTNAWVNRISKELVLSLTNPLASTKVQALLNKIDKLIGQIKEKLDSTELHADYEKLRKDCDDTEGSKLDELVKAIEQSLNDLNSTALLQKQNLTGVYAQRKAFEEEFDRCENWIKECETSLGSDLKGSGNLNVLEEQVKKFIKLEADCEEIQKTVQALNDEGKQMMPSLNEPDRQILADQLSSLSIKVYALSQSSADKLNQLQNAIKELQQASNIIAESREYLNKIKKRVDELNKPMGNNYDETHEVLGTFETLLEDLKTYRKKLDSDEYQALRSLPDFREVLKDMDSLIYVIEGIITKLRHLVLLQQQYAAIVTEIQNFLTNYQDVVGGIQKSGGSSEDNIKLYDDVLARIQYNEAQLASATDKGDRISDEGTIADRNAITEQLQNLKQGLNELKRIVERKRLEDAEAIAEYLKYSQELDDIISWLHDNEVTIKSRPILEIPISSVDNEIRKHETLASEVTEKLGNIVSIEESLPADGLPSSLADKLSEARLLAKVLPQELAERLSYLEKNRSLRQQHEKLVRGLGKWMKEAQDHLKGTDAGINFEKAAADLSDHKTYFNNEKAITQQLSSAKQLVDSIWPCVSPQDQELISKEHQELNDLIRNTFNLSKSKIAELEKASNLWNSYRELYGAIESAIAKAEEPIEPGTNLGALKYNLAAAREIIATLQSRQNEYDNLKERASTIQEQADANCKSKIENQMQELDKRWNDAFKLLDERREDLSKLVSNWEQCEGLWQKFESGLTSIEDHFSQIDPTIRSHQQLNETRTALESILNECNDLEPIHKDLLQSASHILKHLKTASDICYSSLNGKLNHLSEQYKTIVDLIIEKLKWLNGQDTYLTEIDGKIEDYQKILNEIKSNLNRICPYEPNQVDVSRQMKGVDDQIQDAKKSIQEFNTGLKDRFTTLKQILPTSVTEHISGLEIQLEELSSSLNDKMKEFKRLKSVRSDFKKNVQEIKNWIQTTEKNLIDNENMEPSALKQNIQTMMMELPKIQDQMETLEKLGKAIMDTTPDDPEKQDVRNEIDNLQQQINDIRKIIEERNYKIGESLDSWQKFLQLYAQVMAWGNEKKIFLQEPLQLASLPESRLKLNNYTMAVKSLKHVGKQLSEMGRELDRIAEISNVGPLHSKLDEAEQMKVAVETELLERHALLQEMTEEWEQCEKKFYEAKIWLEKTKQSLDQQYGKKKPLRDQLAAKEKLLADVIVQKTKIGLSEEKLQVHFKSGIGGDPNIAEEEAQLQRQLDSIGTEIKDQCSALEAAVAQIDKLQEEVQVLRSQLGSAEQKLRHVCSPSYLTQDRERAAMEQTAWKEKLKVIQSKITARNERIKLLMLLGTPSAEPLHM
ncbi:unnamed protein product [Allacma fusca]|uniref:Calponin-homology (CH) domain-containing protein n=1 Tax=Allacma fusca TaxID=39272 RepID=A0A8J2KH64_9HEXA|nr:unnamed protein product [Allacma fusca]